MNLRKVSSEAVGSFLYSLPVYKENLDSYQTEDNSAIKTKIKELLANNCTLAVEYYNKRMLSNS